MKSRAFLICLTGIALLLCVAFSAAQSELKPSKPTRTPATVGKLRGADPNVKVPMDQVLKNAKEVPAPPEKGGSKTRQVGYHCWVKYDNYTGVWVDCYADGQWVALVPPWGDVTVDVGSGTTIVYAHSHSGDLLWGPTRFNCAPNTVFTWELDPPK